MLAPAAGRAGARHHPGVGAGPGQLGPGAAPADATIQQPAGAGALLGAAPGTPPALDRAAPAGAGNAARHPRLPATPARGGGLPSPLESDGPGRAPDRR